jgi:hypothetical protein
MGTGHDVMVEKFLANHIEISMAKVQRFSHECRLIQTVTWFGMEAPVATKPPRLQVECV